MAPALELACSPAYQDDGQVLLHVSLRYLTAASILSSHNVVDDAEHVNRENTSVALAARRAGVRRGAGLANEIESFPRHAATPLLLEERAGGLVAFGVDHQVDPAVRWREIG